MKILFSFLLCVATQSALAKEPIVNVYSESEELQIARYYLNALTPGFSAAATGEYEALAKQSFSKGSDALVKAVIEALAGDREAALKSADVASASLKRTAILIPYETVAASKVVKEQLESTCETIDRARLVLAKEAGRALSLYVDYYQALPEDSVRGNIVFRSTSQCLPDYQFAQALSYDLRPMSTQGKSWSFKGVFYCKN